jgi:hypothetical protein
MLNLASTVTVSGPTIQLSQVELISAKKNLKYLEESPYSKDGLSKIHQLLSPLDILASAQQF